MHRWRGKVAVVTGASSGIGSAIAVELVKAGMIVVGLARRVELIEKLQEQLPSGGIGKLHAIHCDLTDDADIRQAFSDIYAKIGVVHVLVNNAGIAPVTNVTDEGNDDVLKNVIQTNLWATVLCTKQAVEIMKLQNVIGGHIININSCSGHEVFETGFDRPCLNLYPATKHGITALTEVLSKEFRSDDLGYKVTVRIWNNIQKKIINL